MKATCRKNLVLTAVLVAATVLFSGAAVGQKILPMPTPPGDIQNQKEYFHIEGCGILKTGVRFAGNETTGYTLTADSQTWELDLRNERLRTTAAELHGKCTFVTGTPEFRRYAGRGVVPTIVVDQLRIGKPMQPMGR